ncbi:MAG: YggS family pyridoxal phosphate-dependent enzyme [Acidobacteria bacterium]|nr:YggS family pyridoxal phosphate-dependent enzyme [Acidobacteriota bacterium]
MVEWVASSRVNEIVSTGIGENVARVQERIAAACRRSSRRPEDVRLIAISKTVPAERIREAYEAGLRDFGENRVQEAKAKRPALSDLTVTWHLVGHLQTNKAKPAHELFHWFHALDSFRLAERLEHSVVCSGERLPVLLEVNLGGEETKAGVREEEVRPLTEEVSRLSTLELRGLMVLPPFFEDPEQARPFFRRLRELAMAIEAANLPNVSIRELSMGMSHDFEAAIEEGATMVRVGTAIFGPRPPHE